MKIRVLAAALAVAAVAVPPFMGGENPPLFVVETVIHHMNLLTT